MKNYVCQGFEKKRQIKGCEKGQIYIMHSIVKLAVITATAYASFLQLEVNNSALQQVTTRQR